MVNPFSSQIAMFNIWYRANQEPLTWYIPLKILW